MIKNKADIHIFLVSFFIHLKMVEIKMAFEDPFVNKLIIQIQKQNKNSSGFLYNMEMAKYDKEEKCMNTEENIRTQKKNN